MAKWNEDEAKHGSMNTDELNFVLDEKHIVHRNVVGDINGPSSRQTIFNRQFEEQKNETIVVPNQNKPSN